MVAGNYRSGTLSNMGYAGLHHCVFLGVRPIAELMVGQMTAKIALSFILIPLVITVVVRFGRALDAEATAA